MLFLLELLLQIAFEILANFVPYTPSERDVFGPIVKLALYFLCGAILGYISYLIFQHSFIQNHNLRLVSAFVIPLWTGLIVSKITQIIENRRHNELRLDKFSYAFIFALGISLVRYACTS